MSKEIRNYEFKTQNAQAFINDKGELKFKGKKGGKELKQLQPLFDAILKSDTSYKANKKKLDASEKALMEKLHNLLMADGKIDAEELKLGDEFVNSGLSVKAFIDQKVAETKPKAEVKTEENNEENADEATVVKDDPVVNEIANQNVEIKEAEQPKVEQKPDPRVSLNAFNQTIQNQKMKIQDKKDELTTAFTKEVEVKKGVYLYNIAVQALKDEGVEHPSAKQINERIAEIALVNGINDVNKVPLGKVIKVSRVGAPISPTPVEKTDAQDNKSVAPGSQTAVPENKPAAPGSQPVVPENKSVTPETVAPSSIKVEKNVVDTLTELRYIASEDKTEGEGENAITYTEWTKEGSATMYTAVVDGVVLGAASLEDLRKLKKDYEEAAITAAPENEAADAKATRQAANLENMKKRIELSGGNLDVITAMIDKLREDGNVNLESNEVQTFIQDLVKTKNVDILTKLFTHEVTNEDNTTSTEFTNDLIKNEDTAKTVASLYKEIRDKEKAGEKLTDDEVALKEFMASKVGNNDLYTISANADNGVVEKTIYFSERSGEIIYRRGFDYYANDPKVLDEFVTAINQANAATKDATIEGDTDDKAKERALAAVFKQYVNTDDKLLAMTIANKADELHASKEDVLALVARSDMSVLGNLDYTPSPEDPAFHNAVADRVVALYEAGNGDPANMRCLEDASAIIDATDKSDEDKQKLKDKILDSFFEVTGEGENKTYTFKPSRRPTYEEINNMLSWGADADITKAILDYIPSIEDLGKGQYTQALEKWMYGITTADLKAKYAELYEKAAKEFDLTNNLDAAKEKVLKFIDAVGPNIDLIPFDKIQETFGGEVDFVKEHLGAQRAEDDSILRKLTVLDLDIQESEPDADGKVTYSVAFSMAVSEDWSIVDDVELEADSKEELLKKAEAYIELQNIVYEAEGNSEAYTDDERDVNKNRLNEMFNDENMDRGVKLAIVNFAVGNWGLCNTELIDSIIESKDPDFIKAESIGWDSSGLTDDQVKKLIEYAKDPKLTDGKNNPFYLGTASGNDIRQAIVQRGKKEEIKAIYDSLRMQDKFTVIDRYLVDNPVEKFNKLVESIIDSDEKSVTRYQILNLAINKGYTLSQDVANKLMGKIQRPLRVQYGREQLYSWADSNGRTVFYKQEVQQDGRVKFVAMSAADYAAEIKYEIDNNGSFHHIEKQQAADLAKLSTSGVADVILAYSETGKGLIRSWNDEYAWVGDALGVDNMMPVIMKVLEYGSSDSKKSDEYKALVDLIRPYVDKNGNANTKDDFPSDIATQIDNAMVAYIKKVRGIK